MTIESKIVGIFPTPIYFSKINRELTEKELLFIRKNKSNVYSNEGGNTTSNDNYILNNEIFKNLKKDLELKVEDYFDKIISSSNNIKSYITQSWINFTEKNQYHHKHQHSNSLISGVFYISSDKEFDKIKFFNDTYKLIHLEVKEWNIWNSESIWFPVNTGDIILFPSSLSHMVETKKELNSRISLAFNVFIKGTIGTNKNSNELVL